MILNRTIQKTTFALYFFLIAAFVVSCKKEAIFPPADTRIRFEITTGSPIVEVYSAYLREPGNTNTGQKDTIHYSTNSPQDTVFSGFMDAIKTHKAHLRTITLFESWDKSFVKMSLFRDNGDTILYDFNCNTDQGSFSENWVQGWVWFEP